MERTSLFIAIAGMLILAGILFFQQPQQVQTAEQLDSMQENTYVSLSGTVSSVQQYGSDYLIILDNNIRCIVDKPLSVDSQVTINGIIDRYENKTNIKAVKIIKNGN